MSLKNIKQDKLITTTSDIQRQFLRLSSDELTAGGHFGKIIIVTIAVNSNISPVTKNGK